MRELVLKRFPILLVLLTWVGGGLSRDGSNSDCTLVCCFFTGVRLGDDFRLFEKFFNDFALKVNRTKIA